MRCDASSVSSDEGIIPSALHVVNMNLGDRGFISASLCGDCAAQ